MESRLADFGIAVLLPIPQNYAATGSTGGKKLQEKLGTPCYMAPEILRGQGYDEKCDLFSIGSVLFNLLTGAYLFAGANHNEMMFNNRVCDLSNKKSHLQNVSKECIDFLFSLLNPNPK